MFFSFFFFNIYRSGEYVMLSHSGSNLHSPDLKLSNVFLIRKKDIGPKSNLKLRE